MKKVLFISHDASRTGAPIVLLHFLRWFKANAGIPFQIILRNGGELEPEFEALAPVLVINEAIYNKTILFEKIYHFIQPDDVGLIYSNTITNGKLLEFFSSLKCPSICHVHELEQYIYLSGLENFREVRNNTTYYIAVSEAVKTNLVEKHGLSENGVDVIYEFIPTQLHSFSSQPKRREIHKQLNIPQEALIVGASGTTDWRKGPDLFIQLARAVHQQHLETPVHFIWVGGESEGPCFAKLRHDVKNAGLDGYVHFLGNQPKPLDYFAAFDVFALVSREDPFPLVCLEAASLGKPIVCFDNAGGEKEFVEDDCGFVVPYLDIETMAIKVVKLLESVELRQRFGKQAAQKVRERHDVEVIAPQILDIINIYLKESKPDDVGKHNARGAKCKWWIKKFIPPILLDIAKSLKNRVRSESVKDNFI